MKNYSFIHIFHFLSLLAGANNEGKEVDAVAVGEVRPSISTIFQTP